MEDIEKLQDRILASRPWRVTEQLMIPPISIPYQSVRLVANDNDVFRIEKIENEKKIKDVIEKEDEKWKIEKIDRVFHAKFRGANQKNVTKWNQKSYDEKCQYLYEWDDFVDGGYER